MNPPAPDDPGEPLIRAHESIAYLFDNMDAEMEEIYALDPVISNLSGEIARYQARIGEAHAQEDAATIKLSELESRIADLETQIKLLQRERGTVAGAAHSACHNRGYLRRLIKAREAKIGLRQRFLVKREAGRRLATIGRTIRRSRNNGPGLVITKIEE